MKNFKTAFNLMIRNSAKFVISRIQVSRECIQLKDKLDVPRLVKTKKGIVYKSDE